MMTQLFLNVLSASLSITTQVSPAAVASIEIHTPYAFDDNVVAKVRVVDDKTPSPPDDPLNNLIFQITFADKVDDSVIARLQGRLFKGGGIEALEATYPNDFSYITQKLDFTGALDGDDDFFEAVVTSYDNAEAVKAALVNAGVMNNMASFRKAEAILPVPSTTVTDASADEVKRSLLDMNSRPRYIATCELDDLPTVEALAEVMDKLNCHVLLDIGEITDWRMATALVNSVSIDDHRLAMFWNPNKSRPSGATTVLARKKWRPCIGDQLGQILLRNAQTTSQGIPPLHRPIAGYDFPVAFRDLTRLDGVYLDEEAQNALAAAGINVVINERFDAGDRWIYGDALTQYDSKTSALRLTNASEITTYTDNLVVSIAKKHLLKGMSNYIQDAYSEITRALDACVAAGLLQPATELQGKYYALSLTPRADKPFEAVDIRLARRPEGCARQVYFETTLTK